MNENIISIKIFDEGKGEYLSSERLLELSEKNYFAVGHTFQGGIEFKLLGGKLSRGLSMEWRVRKDDNMKENLKMFRDWIVHRSQRENALGAESEPSSVLLSTAHYQKSAILQRVLTNYDSAILGEFGKCAAVAVNVVTEEFVKELADQHADLERSIEKIIWFVSNNDKEIRLIEVIRTAMTADTVDVFNFSPSEGVPFKLHIADVTPEDWQKVKQGKIALPTNWDLKTAQVFDYD